eukprot:Platyproteum_vivax@DN7143_c0_g1_i1.p2
MSQLEGVFLTTSVGMVAESYWATFADNSGDDFVKYYPAEEKGGFTDVLSRDGFMQQVMKAKHVLEEHGVTSGSYVVHYFLKNTLEDLLFRLAAVAVGCVPVTINWQSDSVENVLYKGQTTKAQYYLLDEGVPSDAEKALSAYGKTIYAKGSLARDASHIPVPTADDARCLRVPTREEDRYVIFTSGTTGKAKAARLSYRSYECNAKTFSDFLNVDSDCRLIIITVNPLHHTNSTAISDWAIRTPGSEIHLFERYSTTFWGAVMTIIEKRQKQGGHWRLIVPLVSRHIDFLVSLVGDGGVCPDRLRRTFGDENVIVLLGSAPVGPSTAHNLQHLIGQLPTVRFGSTETCLQVAGISVKLPPSQILKSFQEGWKDNKGYYIGRAHPPHTGVEVVRSVDKTSPDFMKVCEAGELGFMICKGDNLMTGYMNADTSVVFHNEWYLGLGDRCIKLVNLDDGEWDYYWVARSASLLIKGGTNYSCEQVGSELERLLLDTYSLQTGDIDLAVIGLKLVSEHEDSCCLCLELKPSVPAETAEKIRVTCKEELNKRASKGAKVDEMHFGAVPRNFKGAVSLGDMKLLWARS